ncbi:MAG: hypothetical protein RIG77_24980 [Cyclobacteriaceae bacterium]
MITKNKVVVLLSLMMVYCACRSQDLQQDNDTLLKFDPWQEGYLDIHHINTGGGDAAFFIFPDGTTMLFDAGDMDVAGFNEKYAPMKATDLHPSDSLTAGQWIVHYIKQVLPKGAEPKIDYALVSHFHSDHYGNVHKESPISGKGNYRLTGLTEVGDIIPIKTLIDRSGPNYNYPVNLKEYYERDQTFLNYLDFIGHHSKNGSLTCESLKSGRNDQIVLTNEPKLYPSFRVQNVKCNGTIWSGEGQQTFEYMNKESLIGENGKFNENPLSLAIKVSYGKFDYFTGGDMTGLKGYGKPDWFDVETPVAKAVGQVEVTTLNHHGNRDATNENFVKELSPRVVVQQSWCSDHPGQEVYERLASKSLYSGERDIFATNIHEETKVTFGSWFNRAYKSMEGHIVIRVTPGGDYYVYVLDDNVSFLKLKSKFGPYVSN